jgi:hypothetical protein
MGKVKRITTKTVKPKMLTKDSSLKAVNCLKYVMLKGLEMQVLVGNF